MLHFRDKSNNCSCLGDTLTFECTVMSELGTIWRGSAFNCSSSDHEIYLLRRDYLSHASVCNNGMIRGRVVQLEEMIYTSQLNVTFNPGLTETTVECASDNGSQIVLKSVTVHAITCM